MKTIKEKVMEAWLQDRKMVIECETGGGGTGYILSFRGDCFTMRFDNQSAIMYRSYDNITDIRFVDEGVDLADDGSIMGDFQQERAVALSEMFDNQHPETGIFPTTEYFARLDRAVEEALERQRHVIQSTITLDSSGEMAEPPDELSWKLDYGVEGGAWYVYDRAECVGLGKYKGVAKIDNDVPEHRREAYAASFAAAPDMLDALETVRDKAYRDDDEHVMVCRLEGHEWETIIGAIAKARGEDRE